ncbi:hypothetical protein WT56_00370 [Burkholderia pseudomultivorans]|uniref:Uncharacterized protein n=1 Tax=Burkholderia pseudomultivorans TaxID=1207504 RepID=A0A132EE16_9BURK|nr:hypothetical protein WT56_00370 [Burkholderia pseudomultivorans]
MSIANFDTCIELDQGISGQGVNNYVQSCASHYWVFNTWPEFSQLGGRTGANGSGNYNTALDDVYFTSSLGSGGGGTGPNSIDFVNYKFENDQTPCAFRWGGYTVTPGSNENYGFTNVYKEPLASGASLFCSDSTVTNIKGVSMRNSYVSQDIGPATMFGGMNAATALTQWNFDGNRIYLSSSTLAPTATGGPGINNVTFTGNYLPNLTITPGGTVRSDYLVMVGNWENTLTINQGTYGWQGLTVLDQVVNYTNNSDGFHNVVNVLGKQGGTTFNAATNVAYGTPAFTVNDTSGSNAATVAFQSNGTTLWDVDKSAGNNFRIARYLSGTYTDNPISIANATGVVTFADGMQLPVTTVAGLPSCGGTQKGMLYAVSDANSPSYNAALAGGGSASVPVYCNGSAWTAH